MSKVKTFVEKKFNQSGDFSERADRLVRVRKDTAAGNA